MKDTAKDFFFADMKAQHEALTFDDVLLATGYTEIEPSEARLETRFSRNVSLQIPLVSAAMDTVTEHKMAIEMARLGGLGIIHRNLTPEQQAREVARVKHFLHGFIAKPICVSENQTIEEILRMKDGKGYGFNTFPVLDGDGKFAGILTGNDFEMCLDRTLPAREVMTRNALIASEGILLDDAYKEMQEAKKKVLPVLNSEGRVVGLYTWKDVNRVSSKKVGYNVDVNGQLRVGAAIGVLDSAFSRVPGLMQEGVDVIVVDTAHADTKKVYETLHILKRDYSSLDVVVGNISSASSAKRLLDAGADGIKVGQGGGSICTTRIIAGTGCPQVTAVYQCASSVDIPVCSDGGIRYSGDIVIALAAGAGCVMVGNLLAGTDEAPGDIEFKDGRQWKSYRGMGSLGAMQSNAGSRERYKQSATGPLIPEGVEGLVPYRGKVAEVIAQHLGGIRSGMGYIGASNILRLQEIAEFTRVSAAGRDESHPHSITITKEAPNYPGRK